MASAKSKSGSSGKKGKKSKKQKKAEGNPRRDTVYLVIGEDESVDLVPKRGRNPTEATSGARILASFYVKVGSKERTFEEVWSVVESLLRDDRKVAEKVLKPFGM